MWGESRLKDFAFLEKIAENGQPGTLLVKVGAATRELMQRKKERVASHSIGTKLVILRDKTGPQPFWKPIVQTGKGLNEPFHFTEHAQPDLNAPVNFPGKLIFRQFLHRRSRQYRIGRQTGWCKQTPAHHLQFGKADFGRRCHQTRVYPLLMLLLRLKQYLNRECGLLSVNLVVVFSAD